MNKSEINDMALLNTLLFLSPQMPQNTGATNRTQITLLFLEKDCTLQEDQRRLTDMGKREMLNNKASANWPQIWPAKLQGRKKWSMDPSSSIQRGQMLGPWQFLLHPSHCTSYHTIQEANYSHPLVFSNGLVWTSSRVGSPDGAC